MIDSRIWRQWRRKVKVAKYTPMIEQYLKIKNKYPDAFLFFRLGDFYEMFFEDAKLAARELEITLTARDGGGKEKIPMCGIPHHSVQGYIQTLIDKGYKIAICEQVEDAKQVKGIVKRDVVRIITPGTLLDMIPGSERDNIYLASLAFGEKNQYAISYCDLTTGELFAVDLNGSWQQVILELAAIQPKEIILPVDFDPEKIREVQNVLNIAVSFEDSTCLSGEMTHLCNQLHEVHIIQSIARLYAYIEKTQKMLFSHLQPVKQVHSNTYLHMDYQTKRNLELVETLRTKDRKGSLLHLLDDTMTAMGGRTLKRWIEYPLMQQEEIRWRHTLVQYFFEDIFLREEIQETLKNVYDLERICGRISFGNANPKELKQLKHSLQNIPLIRNLLIQTKSASFHRLIEELDDCKELAEKIEQALVENPAMTIKEGDIIRDGFHQTLDEYRYIRKNGKKWIQELEQKERKETGIKSLKIGYNRIFGYYIEVTRTNLKQLPEGKYIRKQTLANAERFITEDLKEKESMILEAEEKISHLEHELFLALRNEAQAFIPRIQKTAKAISALDVLVAFAKVSQENHYVRPVLVQNKKIKIVNGRHPVVEQTLQRGSYVANDLYLDEKQTMLLITGPNMSGKSTYMRQVILIAIMNQIGCFVPADLAELPVFDQIFTRIGAADDLISGQSTFMVEMMESRYAIENGTKDSLILLDEIGRGTSTYDGMALAQAIIEYIHNHIGAFTLFSTHYHELTDLENELPLLKNVHVCAHEENGLVTFLHKIADGSADKSYGIHVAKLAQMPETLIKRAEELLETFEVKSEAIRLADHQPLERFQKVGEPRTSKSRNDEAIYQMSLFDNMSAWTEELIIELEDLDIVHMTPMQALVYLDTLKQKIKEKTNDRTIK